MDFKEWWNVSPTWKKIGALGCLLGAVACLIIGLTGIVMITYWYHIKHDWLADEIFWWMERGMPVTIAAFVFTRALEIFK